MCDLFEQHNQLLRVHMDSRSQVECLLSIYLSSCSAIYLFIAFSCMTWHFQRMHQIALHSRCVLYLLENKIFLFLAFIILLATSLAVWPIASLFGNHLFRFSLHNSTSIRRLLYATCFELDCDTWCLHFVLICTALVLCLHCTLICILITLSLPICWWIGFCPYHRL